MDAQGKDVQAWFGDRPHCWEWSVPILEVQGEKASVKMYCTGMRKTVIVFFPEEDVTVSLV